MRDDIDYREVAQDAVDKTFENNGNLWETAKDLNDEWSDY